MTVPTTDPTQNRQQPHDSRHFRWFYVLLLVVVGLGAAAAVILWPLYGTAATVLVAVVIAIVHICRS